MDIRQIRSTQDEEFGIDDNEEEANNCNFGCMGGTWDLCVSGVEVLDVRFVRCPH